MGCVRFAHAEGDVSTLEGALTAGAWRGASLATPTAQPREARPTKGGGVLGNDLYRSFIELQQALVRIL